ncbi:SH3 domain-containing protein [Hyunsoonleella rubra]|uniref:SH3 domain-containing protein n=1 Tax=Hyunsoonleella rubra TaxID=1737062 RepID=A0ABW5TE93_9FLAO
MIKNLSIILLIFFKTPAINSQTLDNLNDSISHFKFQQKRIQNEIILKQDSLKFLNAKIKILEEKKLLKKFKNDDNELTIFSTLKREGKLREESSPLSQIITRLQKNDTIKLTDYRDGYWLINKGPYFGYISEMYINESSDLEVFKRKLIEENKKIDSIIELKKKEKFELEYSKKLVIKEKEAEKLKKERLIYENKIISQYGNETGKKLLDGYYWIGMTEKMARISLGEPDRINKTVGSWGVHEQWIYHELYLYFENGKLRSYQNSR